MVEGLTKPVLLVIEKGGWAGTPQPVQQGEETKVIYSEAGAPDGSPGKGAGGGSGVLECRGLGLRQRAVCQGSREPIGFSWLTEGSNIRIPVFGIFLKDTVPDVE